MTQKELKTIYAKELRKAWSDEKMVKFCTNSTAYIVENDGYYYGIEKPKIKKDFCFGYGMYGVTNDEEEEYAENMRETAKTSEKYFKAKNLKEINREIQQLENIAEEMKLNWAKGSHPAHMVETREKYYGQKDGCKLRGFSVVDTRFANSGVLCESVEFVERLIEGYKQVKADFEKRIDSYLKRHGLTKVNAWTYLVD